MSRLSRCVSKPHQKRIVYFYCLCSSLQTNHSSPSLRMSTILCNYISVTQLASLAKENSCAREQHFLFPATRVTIRLSPVTTTRCLRRRWSMFAMARPSFNYPSSSAPRPSSATRRSYKSWKHRKLSTWAWHCTGIRYTMRRIYNNLTYTIMQLILISTTPGMA